MIVVSRLTRPSAPKVLEHVDRTLREAEMCRVAMWSQHSVQTYRIAQPGRCSPSLAAVGGKDYRLRARQ